MDKDIVQMEYNNIRQEIVILMQRCDNLLTTMYTVSITLMGLGFQLKNKYFFLMVLIFIIPIQGLINIRRYHMARCSVYIKQCISSKYKELKWESIVGKIDYNFRESYSKENKLYRLTTIIICSGTIIIALVSIISYIQTSLILSAGIVQCTLLDMFFIIFMSMCFLIICLLVKEYNNYGKIYQRYETILEQILKESEDPKQ